MPVKARPAEEATVRATGVLVNSAWERSHAADDTQEEEGRTREVPAVSKAYTAALAPIVYKPIGTFALEEPCTFDGLPAAKNSTPAEQVSDGKTSTKAKRDETQSAKKVVEK
ncbi:hypothetical protein NDU88_004023 [Pleurodeles waltl]|uniref:Uncharacterized protein n=1 Tax=Pleurodeles waltl TaxID=8319 RepID=A0AAV7RFW6_PLEWA|nr:hypothetical protein NDU88_004023 [Pleurodeles waltl]